MNEAQSNRVTDSSGKGKGVGGTPEGAHEPAAASPGEWQRLKNQINEATEYLSYYLEAQTDHLKLKGRRALFHLALGLGIIVVIMGSVLLALTLIFVGVTQGLALLFGERTWLGFVASGLLLLVCIFAGGGLVIAWSQHAARNRTIQKYEARKLQQKARFGHDIADRAAAARSKE